MASKGQATGEGDRRGAAAALAGLLARPDIHPLAHGVDILLADDGGFDFTVLDQGRATLSVSALATGPEAVLVVRHLLELCFLRGILPETPVLAGLAAARCVALFRSIAHPPIAGEPPFWLAAMAGDLPPVDLDSAWRLLAVHQPGVTAGVTPATAAQLATLWPLLGPTEFLIASGGDTRLLVDPATGLNAYGCSPRPRPWAITFASSTASSISERGYGAAEAARRLLLADAVATDPDTARRRHAAHLRRAIAGYYGLPEAVAVLVVPSGTDGELLALGLALAGDARRPLTNLLVGPEESGSGVPLAAAGRHFSTLTARGLAVAKGGPVAGVPADLELAMVPVRDAGGILRPAAEVAAECAGLTAAAVASGRRVLFHILDQSKTGVVAPFGMPEPWGRRPADVDVLVDASQARLAAVSVRDYVAAGAMVLLTGSKFFTGPPFAGALLVPPSLVGRLHAGGWPAGFADYFEGISVVAEDRFVEGVSAGLALRWEAALAEMDAFAAAGEDEAARVLGRFGDRIAAALNANSDLCRCDAGRSERAGWDGLTTIFAFTVLRPAEGGGPRMPFDVDGARRLYVWLNADLSALLPPDASDAERRLAARIVHIGQPVALAAGAGPAVGAFRLSAGARLVSGEPSLLHMETEARHEREIDDALAVLDKVSLLVRHYRVLSDRDPSWRF